MKVFFQNSGYTNMGNVFFEKSLLEDIKSTWGLDSAQIRLGYVFQPWERRFSTQVTNKETLALTRMKEKFVVFNGPWFSEGHSAHLRSILSKLDHSKTRYLLLSVGSMSFTENEVREFRNLLKEFPPLALSTRDEFTYENYHDLAEFAYNGLCSSFYLPIHYKLDTTKQDFVLFSFDTSREIPTEIAQKMIEDESFKSTWASSELSKLARIRRFLVRDASPEVSGMSVLRSDQIPFRRLPKLVDALGPTLVSPEFMDYLGLYAQGKFCFTSRIHVAAPSAAFGTPSVYLGKSPRKLVLERAGMIQGELSIVNPDLIRKEHQLFQNFLKSLPINFPDSEGQ